MSRIASRAHQRSVCGPRDLTLAIATPGHHHRDHAGGAGCQGGARGISALAEMMGRDRHLQRREDSCAEPPRRRARPTRAPISAPGPGQDQGSPAAKGDGREADAPAAGASTTLVAGDSGAVVEEALTFEERGEPGRRPAPAHDGHHRDRVGGAQDRSQQEGGRPLEAEQQGG